MIKPVICKNPKTGFWQVKYPFGYSYKDLREHEQLCFVYACMYVQKKNEAVKLKRATK